MIQIQVRNKVAVNLIPEEVIVCGNSDYEVQFIFDDEWASETVKTARFVYRRGGQNYFDDVAFTGTTVKVPVLSNINYVLVGVYAGDLITTTPAVVECDKSILCGSGTHKDPTPDVYNQLIELINSGGGGSGGGGGSSVTEVFTATYGTTTYEEIRTAKNSGKICFCKHESGWVFPLIGVWASRIQFAGCYVYTSGLPVQIVFTVSKEDVWEKTETGLKQTSEITSESGNELPTAKAVYNYAQPKGNYLTEHQDISGKLDKNQGSANAGKTLVVGTNGNLVLTDMPEGGSGTSVTEIFSATAYETTYEEIETAYYGGKLCKLRGTPYYLTYVEASKAVFSNAQLTKSKELQISSFIVTSDNQWSFISLSSTDSINTTSTLNRLVTETAVKNYAQPKGDYLTDTDLSGAVNDALAQAKASGEFDGADGKDGTNGKDGSNGKDGTSATHSWNGTVLTVTSASGTSSADLKGAAGKTPVKGTDYWTEADKADIVAAVIEALGGTPIFGVVDTDNNIIVYGDLADGTYSVKYEKENGDTVNIGNLVLDSNVYYTVTNSLIQCTNSNSATEVIGGEPYTATIIPNSGYERYYVLVYMGGVDISSSVVNGSNINIAEVTGDIRVIASCTEIPKAYTNLFSTSGDGFANNTDFSGASSGRFLTNYIPCKDGDVIHVKGATVYKAKAHNSVGNTWGSAVYAASLGEAVSSYDDAVKVYNITQATTGVSNIDKVQLEIRSGNTALDSVIITVNENIVD